MKTQKKQDFLDTFPAISDFVTHSGWIEIGQDEYSRSLVRALDAGGMIWESTKEHKTVDDALDELEKFLTEYES